MEYVFDVLSMGELIADFTLCGSSADHYPVYVQNPGGGGANIAVSVSRLGGRSALLGKTGADEISLSLKNAMNAEGIDLSALVCDNASKIFLAFVHTKPDGERSFTFYDGQTADLKLKPEELDREILSSSKILSYGGRSISTPEIRNTTMTALHLAKKASARIAFDANIRLLLWKDEETARKTILEHLPYCDYLKLSTEETAFLFGALSLPRIVEKLLDMGISLVAITDGPRGASVYTKVGYAVHPGFPVDSIDTTGAGDSFWGSFLLQLARFPEKIPTQSYIQDALAFSCACGAFTTTRQGAVPGMPCLKDISRNPACPLKV